MWRIDNLDPGVYPIAPRRATWYLDEGRKAKTLSVRRTQLPLLPAFAMTAHAAQGQTLQEGVIADLVVEHGSALTAYIAITRVKTRADLLILRPFDKAFYQQGESSSRTLLLRHWRGAQLDWQEILRLHLETRCCSECEVARPRRDFTKAQWAAPDETLVCRECTKRHANEGRPVRCVRCRQWQPREAYGAASSNQHVWTRTCAACKPKRQCERCRKWLDASHFSRAGWRTKRERFCADCLIRKQRKEKLADVRLRAKRRLQRLRTRIKARDAQQKRTKHVQRVREEIKSFLHRRGSVGVQRRQRTYVCPRCKKGVQSSVVDGRVHSLQHCGHIFRVRGGKVVIAGI